MGAPSKKPNIATFRKIANSCGGILSDIAAHIGVDRVTVYAWCNDDPEFKQALEDSRERFLDLAESNFCFFVVVVFVFFFCFDIVWKKWKC